jgi:RNA polymerase sigma factor (TIGR02999 family)
VGFGSSDHGFSTSIAWITKLDALSAVKSARFPGYNAEMSDVTRILAAIEQGDRHAASQLLPLVYDELRKLAVARMAQESPGQTLQATALVHEAYLRLVGPGDAVKWDNRGHFFAAAAEAMRRILVENARQKRLPKHGGGRRRIDLNEAHRLLESSDDLLEVDEALDRLAAEDGAAAEIVKLRLFSGLSVEEAAEALGLPRATAYRHWSFARAWLRCELGE